MKISVVIPTIDGREDLFDRTLAAYKQHKDLELIAPRNFSSIGEAWAAGAERATGDFIHLSADDVIPSDGAIGAGVRLASSGKYPSPRLLNADGSLHSCGTMGGGMLLPECATDTPCNASPFPFFRAQYKDALLKDFPPIHYYADDLLAHRARVAGLSTVVSREYEFTHLEGTVGRDAVARRAMADRQIFLEAVCESS